MSEGFEGRAAIVTGGAQGLGAATAEALAKRGARVIIADLAVPEGQKTAAHIGEEGGEARFIKADVSKAADAEGVASECVSAFRRLDILINNAGIQRYGNVLDTAEEQWDEVLRVNLKSMFLMSKYCVPRMLEAGGGAIVNVASVQGFAAQRGVAAYSASKGGAIALTRAMAVDFAPKVRVNCVCPGSVDTPMLRNAAALLADDPEEAVQRWGKMHPMGRVARPEEVAAAIVFLAGPDASFITGAALLVEGGLLSVIGGT